MLLGAVLQESEGAMNALTLLQTRIGFSFVTGNFLAPLAQSYYETLLFFLQKLKEYFCIHIR
jgi:hypothetical protein